MQLESLCCLIFSQQIVSDKKLNTSVVTYQLIKLMMSTLEKLRLKWGDFQKNLSTTIGFLRNNDDFADVTLVCEGGEEVRAHKIILAASSQVFQKLLISSKHAHPLIYMRGVKSEDLLALVDFIYFGETNVHQDNLEEFLKLAKELNIKGLHAEENNLKQESIFKTPNNLNSCNNDLKSVKIKEVPPLISKFTGSEEQGEIKQEHEDVNQYNVSEEIQELTAKVKSLMVKGCQRFYGKQGWVCSECGKEGSRSLIRSHIEVNHIDGVIIPCNSCDHTCRSTQALRKHKAKLHREYEA